MHSGAEQQHEQRRTFLLLKGDESLSSLQMHSSSLADGKDSSDRLAVLVTILPRLFILTREVYLCVGDLGVDLGRKGNFRWVHGGHECRGNLGFQ